jgi:hypothetical protein
MRTGWARGRAWGFGAVLGRFLGVLPGVYRQSIARSFLMGGRSASRSGAVRRPRPTSMKILNFIGVWYYYSNRSLKLHYSPPGKMPGSTAGRDACRYISRGAFIQEWCNPKLQVVLNAVGVSIFVEAESTPQFKSPQGRNRSPRIIANLAAPAGIEGKIWHRFYKY